MSGDFLTPSWTITDTMPAFAPGTIHDVVVTNPGGLSGTLRNGWIADFLDVPPANGFHDDIVKLVANQVTVGIGGGLYGPDDPVKRQAMAVFVLKAEHGLCYTPPPCAPPGLFADVPCPSAFADWIEAMAAEGITGGCGGAGALTLLPRLAGLAYAREMVFTGRTVRAAEAYRHGIVNRVVADDRLIAAGLELAADTGRKCATAIAYAKNVINTGWHQGLGVDSALSLELERAARYAVTADG